MTMLKKRSKITIFAMFAVLAFTLLAIPDPQTAHAAAGTSGNISAGVSSVPLAAPVALKCYNMEVSADYSIDINDVAYANWTNAADQTTKTLFVNFDSGDVTDNQIKVELVNGSSGTLDTIYLSVTSVETFFNFDLPLELLVPLLMFGIAIVIISVILRKAGRRE